MDRLIVHITQIRNETQRRVGFRVSDGVCLKIRELPPGKTRKIKQSRILGLCNDLHNSRSPDWTIGILIDGRFSGMEIGPLDLLNYARIVINDEWNGNAVLCVEGIPENKTSDHLLRLLFFGCMRNFFWNRRRSDLIDRVDSKMATKLREIEGDALYTQLMSPLAAGIIVLNGKIASPPAPAPVPILSTKDEKPVKSPVVHRPSVSSVITAAAATATTTTTTKISDDDEAGMSPRSSVLSSRPLWSANDSDVDSDDEYSSDSSSTDHEELMNTPTERETPPNIVTPPQENKVLRTPSPPKGGSKGRRNISVISTDHPHRAFSDDQINTDETNVPVRGRETGRNRSAPVLQNPLDSFVNVTLFLVALTFVSYVRVIYS